MLSFHLFSRNPGITLSFEMFLSAEKIKAWSKSPGVLPNVSLLEIYPQTALWSPSYCDAVRCQLSFDYYSLFVLLCSVLLNSLKVSISSFKFS